MSVTEIITKPKFVSEVPGFGLFVLTDIQPETVPDELIAHAEYVEAHVLSDHTNPSYRKLTNPRVVLIFTNPEAEFMCDAHEDILYVSIPANLEVVELRLIENFHDDEPEMHGLNLDVWVKESDSSRIIPFCGLVIAPAEVTVH